MARTPPKKATTKNRRITAFITLLSEPPSLRPTNLYNWNKAINSKIANIAGINRCKMSKKKYGL